MLIRSKKIGESKQIGKRMRHLDRNVRVSFSLGKERKTIGLREEEKSFFAGKTGIEGAILL